jgi:protein O-GlcNAc transferase
LFARIAKMVGKLELAREFLDKAAKVVPDAPWLLLEQADLITKLGHPHEGLRCLERILEIDPGNFEAHAALGRHFAGESRLEEARHHLQLAAVANPTLEVNNLLGHVLVDLGLHADAEKIFQACLESDPNHGDALVQMGSICLRQGDFSGAMGYYRRAFIANPEHPEPLWNIAYICLNTGKPISSCHEWLALTPPVLSKMIFALNYQSDLGCDLIAAAHREWGAQQSKNIPRVEISERPRGGSDARLRLGFVSGDFCQHPVGRLAAALFAHLDRRKFDLYVYDNGSPPDAVTEHLRSLVPNWRDIFSQSDAEAAHVITGDDIQVLIDLSGHTVRNRLSVFARRAAPIQITLFGYPNTTGLDAMDYRITDAFADPPSITDRLYTEKLIRFCRTAWVYLAPESQAAPAAPPRLNSDRFVFGCLNNPQKISAGSIGLWGGVLQQNPEARLLLLAANQTHEEELRLSFTKQGVRADQLCFVPKTGLNGYLEYHQRIDVMLDPFPYNGGVTTCDSLWMGVPVLTIAGDSYVSRQGVSILSNVGLSDFIAETPDAFLEKARALAGSRVTLAKMRTELRARLQQSPMMDYASYARELGRRIEELWLDSAREMPPGVR